MSQREQDGRDLDSRRHHSGFDREPSPRRKKSRRDGQPEAERVQAPLPPSGGANAEIRVDKDRDHKHGRDRRLRDGLPFDATLLTTDSKVESKGLEKYPSDGTKHSSDDPTQVPRSRSYFQHDKRGNAAQVGRSFSRGAATERQWRDSKDDRNERATNKSTTYDLQQKDEKSQVKGDNEHNWRRDGFLKMEAEPPRTLRKRPAFREKKILVETENSNKSAIDPARPSLSDHRVSVSERREERDRNPRHLDRSERPAGGDSEAQRGGLKPRERYGGAGGGSYRGRERFNGRQGYRRSGTQGEKWKHDLFDEANKSPTKKNEEDQIAKVEALLAS